MTKVPVKLCLWNSPVKHAQHARRKMGNVRSACAAMKAEPPLPSGPHDHPEALLRNQIPPKQIGHLEKLLSLAIADSTGVNENKSERERSEIIRRQFCGVRRIRAIFRGAHPFFLSLPRLLPIL